MSNTKIVSWADGTWEEIAAMIEAHDKEEINLYDHWKVGDEREITISEMEETPLYEGHAEQPVTLVLVDKGDDSIHFIWQQKDGLSDEDGDGERGFINAQWTNKGGWRDSIRRAWCNEVYFKALPEGLQKIALSRENKTSEGGRSKTIVTTSDRCFLPAEVEIFGEAIFSVEGKGEQWEWYRDEANRIKHEAGGSAYYWWERSPVGSSATAFCFVSNLGTANASYANGTFLLAPCGCI